MTVKELKMFTILCNICGEDVCSSHSDYAGWTEMDTPLELADACGWKVRDVGKFAVCEPCFMKRVCRIFGHAKGYGENGKRCTRCGAIYVVQVRDLPLKDSYLMEFIDPVHNHTPKEN